MLRPCMSLLIRRGWVNPYGAAGYRDLHFAEWQSLIEQAGLQVVRLNRSLWPALFGPPTSWPKTLLVKLLGWVTPVRMHYMAGFVCRKRTAEP